MLYEVSTLCCGQSNIDGLNKTSVIFQVMAQYLLREFVCLQPSLLSNLG